MNIIKSNIKTISSLDFLGTINIFRKEAGQSPIEPRKFIDKIEDELDDLSGKKFRTNSNQSKSTYYELSKDQMMLVGMRESKAVRKKVLSYLKSLESNNATALPQSFAEALQLAADQAKQLELAAPKVEYHDKVLASDNGLLTTEIASELGMSAIKLNRLLRDLKVQRKVGGRWVLTAAMLGQGLTIESTFIDDNGNTRHAMKWTEAGRKLMHELLS